jgi:hypothetical protein
MYARLCVRMVHLRITSRPPRNPCVVRTYAKVSSSHSSLTENRGMENPLPHNPTLQMEALSSLGTLNLILRPFKTTSRGKTSNSPTTQVDFAFALSNPSGSQELCVQTCPFCHDTKGKQDNLHKLYIHSVRGTYKCHRCDAHGSW